MKVFGCTTQIGYSGGIILVAANTVEEAFLTAATDEMTRHMFDWYSNEDFFCHIIEPDGNVEHAHSSWYPFEAWREYPELTANVDSPKVLLEESHEG